MKKLVYLVIKQTPDAFHALEAIRNEGYNGTIVSTESLHHVVEESPADHHFINLRHIEQMAKQESVMCLFVVEDAQLENIKDVIRRTTENFTLIKGFMFSRSLEDYEGTI